MSGAGLSADVDTRANPAPEQDGGTCAQVLCLVTGQPTPLPASGPRSMYVNPDARNLRARLNQAETLVWRLVDQVGFTPLGRTRLRTLLRGIELVTQPDGARTRPRRATDGRASVRLAPGVAELVDQLDGPNRTAKVNALLLDALEARATR